MTPGNGSENFHSKPYDTDFTEKDLYRDTWVRYLGYANEVGESFRALVPLGVVRASYALAFGYVLADTADKAYKMKQRPLSSNRKVAVAACDALIWQTLASVIIPGFVINRVCALSMYGLKRTSIERKTRGVITALVGLAAIPVVVHPIDDAVTYTMDRTIRKMLH